MDSGSWPGGSTRFEHRGHRLVRLADDETLAVDRNLKPTVFERDRAIATNLEWLKLPDERARCRIGRHDSQ
jgi:hypothetical protein